MFDSSVYSTQTMNTANRLRLVEQLSEQWGTFTLEKYITENWLPMMYIDRTVEKTQVHKLIKLLVKKFITEYWWPLPLIR